jgi:ATP-dependent DNA helicase PIF1
MTNVLQEMKEYPGALDPKKDGEKYTRIISQVIFDLENQKNVFLSGCGGVGKTYAINIIARHFSNRGKLVACTATTGIAAIPLSIPELGICGSTLHSWSGVGLGQDTAEKLFAKVKESGKARTRWMKTHLLIVDEVSMLSAEFITKLDYIGRQIRRCPDFFGGIVVLFSGDFLQLPPVNANFVFLASEWEHANFSYFILEEPKRYKDLEWFALLQRMRKGNLTEKDCKFLKSKTVAYEKWISQRKTDELIVKPTVLHSKKIDVETENERELKILPGPLKTYRAQDTFKSLNGYAKAEHYLKPLEDAIPEVICLKVGAQVMLKANLDLDAGLANGSRGVVVAVYDDMVRVKWMSGSTTLVDPFVWLQKDKDGIATRSQIPLILAWSLTIHKCQGCSLDYVIGDLSDIFCDHQGYVLASRVRTSEGLLLVNFNPKKITVDTRAVKFMERIEALAREREGRGDEIDETDEPCVTFILVFGESSSETETVSDVEEEDVVRVPKKRIV